MSQRKMRIFAFIVFFFACAAALDNGAAPTPPMGWSSWLAVTLNPSDAVLRQMADLMVSTGLRDAGYTYLLLDDGWPACDVLKPNSSFCLKPSPRDQKGRIVPDKTKFPQGIAAVSEYVHSLGLKFGIYTAPHAQTCGGFMGSLGHELADAQTFADWGIDFVKLDAGCQNDCSIHDGCLIASLTRMRDGLNATGRTMVYYIDDGNPTSFPKVYNPYRRSWPSTDLVRTHFAVAWNETVMSWGPALANMWKLWFDRSDMWQSLMDNVHQQVGMQWVQSCGAYNNPDMMTVGRGGMTQGQYRAEVFLYAVLGAPLILSCDLRVMLNDTFTRELVTNPEIIAINQDADCVQATSVGSFSSTDDNSQRWAADVWVRPLSDGSFAATLVNKDPTHAHDLELRLGTPSPGDYGGDEDFMPAGPFASARVRDVYNRVDLGVFETVFVARAVPPMDAVLVRVFPLNTRL